MGSSGGGSGPTPEQKELQRRQIQELNELDDQKNRRTAALQRRQGRSSLIYGSERGVLSRSERKADRQAERRASLVNIAEPGSSMYGDVAQGQVRKKGRSQKQSRVR